MYFKILLTSLIALTFAGCDHNHENENQSEAEEAKFQYTAYSEHFELFAEADPFVIGQMSNILSHFSNLPEFTAVTKGAITLRIIVNSTVSEQTLESPARKGIYSFDIMPEVSGDGTMEYLIKTDTGDYKVIVPEVTVYSGIQEATEAAGKNTISRTNATVFTKEQSWKIDFSTGYPVRKPFGQVIKTTAQVQSAQDDEVFVTAKASGVISFSGNNILEGKSVSAGQTLITISGSGLAENNSAVRYAGAQNNFEKARADYERAKILAEDKIVSEKQLLEAKTIYENSRSVYENLSQNFSASGQTVISPATGFIKELYVKNGLYVEAGQPLIMITQNRSLILRAEVQQKYAQHLMSIANANIRTIEDNRTYTLEELNGKVLSVGKTTTSDNFLIPVILQINNATGFVPGSFVELYLKTISSSQALTIPISAVLEEQGNFFVFVQLTPELFEKREIKTGVSDGINVEVMSGLADDERIVTKGGVLIKLAQATGTLDAHSGHVH
ncbi:MAG: efflux RND transporter periplasmic adaptor subunit [Bacteroidales bacterium]|nr:efflux RND transporter periplasmic adaptor subunit [Bacteroidales bacterium]